MSFRSLKLMDEKSLSSRICAILSRGFMYDEASFLDGSGRTISWKYFVNLNKLQNNLGLHLRNKIRNLKN
ncbi:hypothetical protein Bhyg_11962 [Pseudolycoriella hygida]|uniref:Uncharacterized protein n=1 Tax=Pseudolycoriella hygida TaxID=35572 RepID=A0A9Q0MWM8_9DIPT|nr:hypothetical protein Bhyg_11962 [Pseudolycoriella hygida]